MPQEPSPTPVATAMSFLRCFSQQQLRCSHPAFSSCFLSTHFSGPVLLADQPTYRRWRELNTKEANTTLPSYGLDSRLVKRMKVELLWAMWKQPTPFHTAIPDSLSLENGGAVCQYCGRCDAGTVGATVNTVSLVSGLC